MKQLLNSVSFGTYTRAASWSERDFFKLGFNSCVFVNAIELGWWSTSYWSLLACSVRVFSVFPLFGFSCYHGNGTALYKNYVFSFSLYFDNFEPSELYGMKVITNELLVLINRSFFIESLIRLELDCIYTILLRSIFYYSFTAHCKTKTQLISA